MRSPPTKIKHFVNTSKKFLKNRNKTFPALLYFGGGGGGHTEYEPHNKRRKSNHSQQKQSHKSKSHFQFHWYTLKVFNFARMNICEHLKFSNSWVFSFAKHRNRWVSCVLNFARQKDQHFFVLCYLIFKKHYFCRLTKILKTTKKEVKR